MDAHQEPRPRGCVSACCVLQSCVLLLGALGGRLVLRAATERAHVALEDEAAHRRQDDPESVVPFFPPLLQRVERPVAVPARTPTAGAHPWLEAASAGEEEVGGAGGPYVVNAVSEGPYRPSTAASPPPPPPKQPACPDLCPASMAILHAKTCGWASCKGCQECRGWYAPPPPPPPPPPPCEAWRLTRSSLGEHWHGQRGAAHERARVAARLLCVGCRAFVRRVFSTVLQQSAAVFH